MGFIASDNGGGNFKRTPTGMHMARCYSVIDLGTQLTTGQFGEKLQHKIQLGWELHGEDDDGNPLTIERDGETLPMTISKRYTMSLHEKAGLRKDLVAWRGKDFTAEEAKGFDVSKLLDAWCMVNVTESTSGDKTYSNVAGLSPVPAALRKSKPDPVLDEVIFNLDDPDTEVFNDFHEKLQETIKKSPEWARYMRQTGQTPQGQYIEGERAGMPAELPDEAYESEPPF